MLIMYTKYTTIMLINVKQILWRGKYDVFNK